MRIRALTAVCLAAGAVSGLPVAAARAAGTTTTTATTPAPTPTPTPLTATTPASTTTTPTTTTPTTTTPAAAPTPAPAVKARPALYLRGLFSADRRQVTVPGRTVTVHGVIRPYVAGQRVRVQLLRDGRLFATRTERLKPSARKVYGGFTLAARAPRAGTITVRVKHFKNAHMLSFVTRRQWTVLPEDLHDRTFVALVQSRLAALHFYIPRTGVFDNGTELAIDAYHRLLGWGEGQLEVGPATVTDLLDGKGAFHVRYPKQGHHAEGDLSDQVLALTDGSKVQLLFPISSGKPSTPTILGNYQVYRKQPGYLPDGMYFSAFFTGGYAIHGYDPAPDYPASHGCMRLPIVDAIPAYDWIDLGDWVDTYYT